MAERIINTWRDPYDEGFSTCRPKQIVIRSGMTVLVGCNGAGKTTLLHNIQSELKKENIPCHLFDNLHDGGTDSRSMAAFEENWSFFATSMASSEGENINMNLNNLASKLKEFMMTGRIADKLTRMGDAFARCSGVKEYEVPETKERWLLLDAIDSGFSIDNVIETKEFFEMVISDFADHGYELYIVASANEFELAYNAPCMDVTNGKYLEFDTYDKFKKFIIESRKKKDKREEKVREKHKNSDE